MVKQGNHFFGLGAETPGSPPSSTVSLQATAARRPLLPAAASTSASSRSLFSTEPP